MHYGHSPQPQITIPVSVVNTDEIYVPLTDEVKNSSGLRGLNNRDASLLESVRLMFGFGWQ